LATKIRLKRIGRRNRPFYRLVIMDARNRRDGAAIEEVGWYNPIAKDEMYSLKEDRILHWLQEGAQPTDTAHDILRTAGLAHKWHLMKQGLDEAAVEKEMQKWALEREDVLKRRHQRAEAKVADKKAAAEKRVAEKAAAADTATEVDDKSVPATAEAAVDEAPADVEKSADDGTDAAAKKPAEKADDGATEEPTEKEDTAAEETEAEDESAETAAEEGTDEQEEDSAAEDKEVQEEQEEDKSTDEVEPQKDKSGKKGSKKIAKKNGQETDDK